MWVESVRSMMMDVGKVFKSARPFVAVRNHIVALQRSACCGPHHWEIQPFPQCLGDAPVMSGEHRRRPPGYGRPPQSISAHPARQDSASPQSPALLRGKSPGLQHSAISTTRVGVGVCPCPT